jgi:hypothetical protein
VAWDPSAVKPEELAKPGMRAYLALYSRKTTVGEAPGRISALEILEDWPEGTSWQAQPPCRPEPFSVHEFEGAEGWKVFDVTSLLSEGKGEHGVILKFESEERSGNKRDWSGYAIVSREGSGEWDKHRPSLVLVEKTHSE